jgi:predicted regulator of Ras-like GTPase activity (Roadblock/LC7/MglB family)
MSTLPQLIDEDVRELDAVLRELLSNTEATTAIVIDKGGFLITHCGDAEQFDLTTIAALASGSFLANQTIANLVHEESFDSIYQQGESFSIFAINVDEYCLLVVIFAAVVSVGAVKYFAARTCGRIAAALRRRPAEGPQPRPLRRLGSFRA